MLDSFLLLLEEKCLFNFFFFEKCHFFEIAD